MTQAADELRTSWYPDEPGLDPATVSSPSFGQIFSTSVNGQVYAQPLVSQGTLLVVTENNVAYGLNPQTGAINWQTAFGSPAQSGGIGCGDIVPNIGITGTPVIDQSTNIAYFFLVQHLSGTSGPLGVFAHALNVGNGVEQPGFPVHITGTASNDNSQTFQAGLERQRGGLLLLNGVVYAPFGGYCDHTPWQGWVVGVSTKQLSDGGPPGTITTMWTTEAGPNKANGAAIWQSAGALVSDAKGQILFATGNSPGPGSVAGPLAGTSPPGNLSESVVRLSVQNDGSLLATDFFAPYDAQQLDSWDGDLSSGAPVGLPAPYFGTSQYPNLAVQVGKQGYFYVLNLASLGGIGMGMGGGDAVVSRVGPYGGVWSKPAVWPGDGGYIYVPTNSNGTTGGGATGAFQVLKYGLTGNGVPTFSLVATSSDGFGYGSGPPVVTSNGTASGSALVWTIWGPDGTGNGAQLRAYDPVPVNGALNLRFSASIGQLSKFATPGVAANRVYVGTRDSHVIGFGSQASSVLSGSGVDFGAVNVGSNAQATLTVTASAAATVTGVSISSGQFSLGATTPALPAMLAAGGTVSIPVTFAPTTTGMAAATVSVANSVPSPDGGTSSAVFNLSVTGTGRSTGGVISASPASVSFGGTTVGGQIVDNVTFSNTGGGPLTINSVGAPNAPFVLSGAPAAGTVLSAGGSVVVSIAFQPTATGMYTDSLSMNTTAGSVSVSLSGSCQPPGVLSFSPLSISYGTVGIGRSISASFTITNTGGSPVTITKSKPPSLGAFNATTTFAEGTAIAAQSSVTETVAFAPTQPGPASDAWVFNSDSDSGLVQIQFSGLGATDLTQQGTAIALITSPTGSGNKSLAVIHDGVYPPVGSTNGLQQYDTYTGQTRTEDWIGYQFSSPLPFAGMTFQDGKQFHDGGWFKTLNVQVLQSGSWVTVPNVTFLPSYKGNDNINYETYNISFPSITGTGIRLDGQPGGSATFISVGELRVLDDGTTAPPPDGGGGGGPDAGADATVDAETDGSAADATVDAGVDGSGADATVDAGADGSGADASVDGGSSPDAGVDAGIDGGTDAAAGNDITNSGTAIALITNPTGSGSKSLAVIHDGIYPPVGSTNSLQQYDTYTGQTRTEDWIGYQFSSAQNFVGLIFQDGKQFSDGGWFTTLNVQVRDQTGTWNTVSNVTITPAYKGHDKVNYETYDISFPATPGTGIRLDGTPGGTHTFISVGELRVLAQ